MRSDRALFREDAPPESEMAETTALSSAETALINTRVPRQTRERALAIEVAPNTCRLRKVIGFAGLEVEDSAAARNLVRHSVRRLCSQQASRTFLILDSIMRGS